MEEGLMGAGHGVLGACSGRQRAGYGAARRVLERQSVPLYTPAARRASEDTAYEADSPEVHHPAQ